MSSSKSYRLDRVLLTLIKEKARDLATDNTWVIKSALAEYFGDELRQRFPNYRVGRPYKGEVEK